MELNNLHNGITLTEMFDSQSPVGVVFIIHINDLLQRSHFHLPDTLIQKDLQEQLRLSVLLKDTINRFVTLSARDSNQQPFGHSPQRSFLTAGLTATLHFHM